MELIRTVMLNVVLIVFLTTLLDLLLPDGSLRSYVKMVMGFFVMLALLQPVMQLISPDGMLHEWQMTMPAAGEELYGDAVAVQGDVFEQQQRQLDSLYQEKINEQVRSLLLLSTEVNQLDVDCTVEGQTLKQIRVTVAAEEPVDTGRIAQALSGYYGLDTTQITVREDHTEKNGEDEQHAVE